MAASTKASVAAFIDRSFRSDYVVDSGSKSEGFATSIENKLRSAPEVQAFSPVRLAPANIDGISTSVMAVDTVVIDSLYDLGVTAGSMTSVHGATAAVSSDTANHDAMRMGDLVPVRLPTAQRCR